MNLQQAISETRRMCGNPSVDVHPSYRFEESILAGLQDLNRRVPFYGRTESQAVKIVAGQNFCLLPNDVVKIIWVDWNGNKLQMSDQDEWRRRGIDFQNAPPGAPQEWTHWTNQLLIYPPPDPASVAAAPVLTVRYNAANSEDIPLEGFQRMNLQDQRIVLYRAASHFLSIHGQPRLDPESLAARISGYDQRFETEAKLMKEQYDARMVQP